MTGNILQFPQPDATTDEWRKYLAPLFRKAGMPERSMDDAIAEFSECMQELTLGSERYELVVPVNAQLTDEQAELVGAAHTKILQQCFDRHSRNVSIVATMLAGHIAAKYV